MKKSLTKIFIIFLAVLSVIVGYFLFGEKIINQLHEVAKNQILTNSAQKCLSDDEVVEYSVKKEKNGPNSANILIKNKNTNEIISQFQINNIIPNHYHGYELHKCGVYVVREFNFDYKTGKTLSDFRMEVWRFRYDAVGEKVAEENDFRVDPTETYVALVRDYSGKPDYAFVIKNLNTKENSFVLKYNDIIKQYPDFAGNFGFPINAWTKDGKYFWAQIFDGAYVLALIQVNTSDWIYKAFETSQGTMGGDAFNPETAWITYDDGAPWTGDADFDQMYREQWQKEGKKVHFYLYNLLTKKQILLETFDDPTWFTKPRWLSDSELQYELPSGEKKIYKISGN